MCCFSKKHQQDMDTSLVTVYPPLLMTRMYLFMVLGKKESLPHATGSFLGSWDRGTEKRDETPAQTPA